MPSSTKNKNTGEPPFGDPYQILGIEQGASDAEISKAYRKLALKLHPDKVQNLSPQQQEETDQQFHLVQEARNFLLEPEHQEARRKYDTKRASQQLRKQQDAVREATMSARRKQMRDELKRKEDAQSAPNEKDLLEKLKKQGQDLRESHANRAHAKQVQKASKQEKRARLKKEERQVRLKWSRKRIQTSPSEHSLATLLSKFGPVESVGILGSKGNSALVTFENASSCRPCVDAYETSNEMRASFVGKRKDEYEEEMYQRDQADAPPTLSANKKRTQDDEGLEERKHRQAAERERLAREMEMEDAGHAVVKEPAKKHKTSRPFPFEFATTEDDATETLSPLQKLEQFETSLFGTVLSSEQLNQMQMTQ